MRESRTRPFSPEEPEAAEYRLLLPQRFNDGRPIPLQLRGRLEQHMLAEFGGFTVIRGLEGATVDSHGRRCDDRSDEYRLATADEHGLLRWALEVGRLLEQESLYVGLPGGRAIILPTPEAATISRRCAHVAHYVLPPEAVANLLRLPSRRGQSGEWILHYSYFEQELRTIRIVLSPEALPRGLTCTTAGIAVVGLTGTRMEILAANETQLARVEAFLTAKLAEFAR